jgi:glycolate oxidase iron-sulfur subunit
MGRLGGFVLAHVITHPRRVRAATSALYAFHESGLAALVRRTGILARSPLAAAVALAPRVPSRAARRAWPAWLPAHGRRRARVAYLRGCVAPEFLPEIAESTLAVLRHNGCDVVTPPEQRCCGALHVHAGREADGRALARDNVRAFAADDVDAVIVDAAGCGSTLKEYGRLYAGDAMLAGPAAGLSRRVRDASEFLAALGLVPPVRPIRARVAYDDPCHLIHGQRIAAQPRALLDAIPGLERVPLADADRCCGSAGIYNLVQPALANAILDAKIAAIASAQCDLVATANPGCILQIRYGLQRAAAAMPRLAAVAVVHPMQLLAAAYGAAARD